MVFGVQKWSFTDEMGQVVGGRALCCIIHGSERSGTAPRFAKLDSPKFECFNRSFTVFLVFLGLLSFFYPPLFKILAHCQGMASSATADLGVIETNDDATYCKKYARARARVCVCVCVCKLCHAFIAHNCTIFFLPTF